MKRTIGFFTFSLLLLFASSALAKTPIEFLKDKESSLQPLLSDTKKNEKKIVGIITSMMDFEVVCKESLGKHWTTLTSTQQTEFKDTLRAVIEKNLISRIKDNSKRTPEYKTETVKGATATVLTLVQTSDDPRAEKTEIEYLLEKRGDSWITVNMITDGISLVGNYRSQFNKIITEQSYDALLKKLKDKLAE